MRFFIHFLMIAFLTLLTQLGGLAWLLSRSFKQKFLIFLAFYVAFWGAAHVTAPLFGRVALSCLGSESYQLRSPMFCALNRHYVTPEIKALVEDSSAQLRLLKPTAKVQVLDGNFPFLTGFPLLPHLSHDDGEKIDFAFFYHDKDAGWHVPSPSPIGYWGFEDGPSDCPQNRLTLRWDLDWLQPHLPQRHIDVQTNQQYLQILLADARTGKILLEPHLQKAWQLNHEKLRFQGCRAARHDDHFHLQR